MKDLKIFKITSIGVILLGSIHLAATPFIYPVFQKISYQELASLYMFIMVGISTLFNGWLQISCIGRLSKDGGYKRLLVVSVIFMIILGIGAVASMWQNPFAYMAFLIACIQTYIIYKFHIE